MVSLADITGFWWVKPLALTLGVIVYSGAWFVWGYHTANNNNAAAVTKQIVTQVKYMPGETKYITQTQTKIQKQYVPFEKVIYRDVSNNPTCDLSPDALKLWNDARNLSTLSDPDGEGVPASTNNP